MKMTMIMSIISMLFLVVLFLIPIVLQIFLSTRKNKWLGLILPIILVMFSIMSIIGYLSYAGFGDNTLFLGGFPYLILLNIPTIISFVIYFVCRKKLSKNQQLKQMNIQDLE